MGIKGGGMREIVNCLICNELLVFPRGGYSYCEDCGWPDEDFGDIYGYPKIGAKLEKYQPGLEFFDEVEQQWIPSGVVTSTMKPSYRGLYRYKLRGHDGH